MPQPSNPYLDQVAAAAKAAGIDPTWAQATLLTENAPGNPSAVSSAGAEGLMQVLPTSAPGVNLSDPAANIKAGVAMLAANLKAAGGDKSKASAMYFDGPNAKTFGPGAYSYVGKVAQNYNNLESQDMPQGSQQASDTPALDALMANAQQQLTAPASQPSTQSGATTSSPAQASDTPALDAMMNTAQQQVEQQQKSATQQGGIGANLKAGVEDVLIRPGLALDNALNGTKVGTFLQNNNILATPAQDEATYQQDTSNLGTTLPDQAARFVGQAATAAPVLAAGGALAGAGLGAAGAGLDAAGAGTAANVVRGVGQLAAGTSGGWGAGVGQGAARLASMGVNGAAQGAGFNALTGRSPLAGAELGFVSSPVIGGAGHALLAGGEAALDSARPATQAAAAKLTRALSRDGITPNQLIATMQAMGPEAAAADAGGQNVLRTADAVATKPGASTQIAAANLGQRAAERVDRLVGSTQDATGQTGAVHDTIAGLMQQRSQAAKPLFDAVNQIVPTAEQLEPLAPVIESSIGQSALKTGLGIMQNEALANGEKFDPSQYGLIVGNDGKMSVAPGAPSMPLLQAVKKGLDAEVESNRNDIGVLPKTEPVIALDSLRNSFRNNMVQQFPAYGDALNAWSGPSAAINAVNMGRRALNNDPEVTANVVSSMPDNLKEFYLQGVTRQITDKMQANPTATVNQILKNRTLQSKISAAFPTPEAYSGFIANLQNEATMMRTENLVNKGSQTAARGESVRDLSTPLAHALFAGRDLLAGSPGGAAYNAARVVGHLSSGASPSDDELGRLLLTPGNTEELQNLLIPTKGAAKKALAAGAQGAGAALGAAGNAVRLYGAPSQNQPNALLAQP
jgi:hypothetical protein